MQKILVVDAGGTKTSLHIYSDFPEAPRRIAQGLYKNSGFSSFYQLLESFLEEHGENFSLVILACAGMTQGSRVDFTNLPWTIHKEILLGSFFPWLDEDRLLFLNDLEATAWYPAAPGPSPLIKPLSIDNPPGAGNGNFAVLSAGTGLGQAFGIFTASQKDYYIIPGEGGHGHFSPSTPLQLRLAEYYAQELPLSHEFFLSGNGLVRLYTFLANQKQTAHSLENPAGLPALPEEITRRAKANDPMALEAISLFGEILAGAAQDCALKVLSHQGIYLTGGLFLHLLPFLDPGKFRKDFCRNEKMGPLLERIPIWYLNSSEAPIHGALAYGRMRYR